MFEKVISKKTKVSLDILGSIDFIKKFYLAGGTGCTLWFGHRISRDLDFFSMKDFSPLKLRDILKKKGDLTIDKIEEGTLIGELNKVRISFFHYPYPLIKEKKLINNIYIANWVDISCMKIDTISARGKKRDFIDLYIIIKESKKNLDYFIDLFRKKYKGIQYNIIHLIKSLSYFDDADSEPLPKMLTDIEWEEIKEFFTKESKSLLKKELD